VQPPPEPLHATRRLGALQSLPGLDTLPEERFERIMRLGCRVLNVPIALVSLADQHRQRFKSRQGLDACETRREVSCCAHAILHAGPFVVPDAVDDAGFADDPLVVGDPGIRSSAGRPAR